MRGKQGFGKNRSKACIAAAGRNETRCEELAPNCTWSSEKKMCYSIHSYGEHNKKPRDKKDGFGMRSDRGFGGQGKKRFDRSDACIATAGRNQTMCKALAAKCI